MCKKVASLDLRAVLILTIHFAEVQIDYVNFIYSLSKSKLYFRTRKYELILAVFQYGGGTLNLFFFFLNINKKKTLFPIE